MSIFPSFRLSVLLNIEPFETPSRARQHDIPCPMSITSNNLKVREIIHQVVNDPNYRAVSAVPLLSPHQLGLIALAYIGVLSGIILYLYADWSLWIVYPIMIFSFYTSFTPLHDATHRAVSSSKRLNDWLGTISGNLLFPFVTTGMYRFLHLSHHRYVGDKDLDPDEGMVAIPTRYFPLGYLILFFPDFLWMHWVFAKAWKRTPVSTRISTVLMFVGNLGFHFVWFMSPFWYEYLILFFIPNRLGIGYVAYAFAHIQHPEGLQWNEYPFQTTFSLRGNKHYLKSFFGQAHHAMHHFLPHIPWYKYHQVWGLANGVFRRQHIPERGVFTRLDKAYKSQVIEQAGLRNQLTIPVRVTSISEVARGVKAFVFESITAGETLPPFSAGSHIRIHLPSGLVRSYSLVNPPFETETYQIAVKLEANSRGGSKEMHDMVKVGDELHISPPHNNFVLYEAAKKYLLIAGGIGITPLLSMAHRLTETEHYFELHICARSKADIPFLFELQNWSFAPNVEIHVNKEGKSSIDLDRVFADPGEDTLIYVCGPQGFNHWVYEKALSMGWQKEQLKQELFSSDHSSLLDPKDFELVLQKSGKSIPVRKDETIIDSLQFHNVKVPYSCLQGTCGTCITDVLEGDIDHRDAVLSEEEKMAQQKMCLCVSRAKGDRLVIDI